MLNPGIRAIEDSIIKKLTNALGKEIFVIAVWHGDPGSFKRSPINDFGILVRWQSELNETKEMSASEDPAGNDVIIQDATMVFEVVLMGQDPKDDTRKHADYLDTIKGILNGFKPVMENPSHCLILQNRGYMGQINDYHVFNATFGYIIGDEEPLGI